MNIIKWIVMAIFALSAFYFVGALYNSNYDAFYWSKGSKIFFGIITFFIIGGTYSNVEEESRAEKRAKKEKQDQIRSIEKRLYGNK